MPQVSYSVRIADLLLCTKELIVSAYCWTLLQPSMQLDKASGRTGIRKAIQECRKTDITTARTRDHVPDQTMIPRLCRPTPQINVTRDGGPNGAGQHRRILRMRKLVWARDTTTNLKPEQVRC